MAVTLLGLRRANRTDLLWAQLLLPLYWAMIGVATIRAAVELARQPFHWFKSPHSPFGLPIDALEQTRPRWQGKLGEEPAE